MIYDVVMILVQVSIGVLFIFGSRQESWMVRYSMYAAAFWLINMHTSIETWINAFNMLQK